MYMEKQTSFSLRIQDTLNAQIDSSWSARLSAYFLGGWRITKWSLNCTFDALYPFYFKCDDAVMYTAVESYGVYVNDDDN